MSKNRTIHSSKKNESGFTLLELLVVMVIISTLAVIGLRTFLRSQMRGRDAKRKNDLEQITRALEMYRSDKGYYPVNSLTGQTGQIRVAYDSETKQTSFVWGEVFNDLDNSLTIYMPVLPMDPSGLTYYYQAYHRDTGDPDDGVHVHAQEDEDDDDYQAEAYKIFAFLENGDDPEATIEAAVIEGSDCDDSAADLPCNFLVYSFNILPIAD